MKVLISETKLKDSKNNFHSLFDKEDSLLVIINEPVSENIEKNIENMYHKGIDELNSGLNPEIEKEITDLNKRIIEMDGEIASGAIKEDKKPPHY